MKLTLITPAIAVLTTIATLSTVGPAHAVSFAGTSSGTWGTPNPGGNTSPVFSGVGTDTFTWGTPSVVGDSPNRLSFVGTSFLTNANAPFEVGTLTYFNGTTLTNTTVDSVPLNVSLAFTLPNGFPKSFLFDFNLISTPNTGTPDENADFVFPPNSFSSESFSWNGQNYTLKLLGFSKDGGGTLVDKFRVRESETDSAALFATVTAVPPRDVPEPTAIAGLSLLGIYFTARYLQQRFSRVAA